MLEQERAASAVARNERGVIAETYGELQSLTLLAKARSAREGEGVGGKLAPNLSCKRRRSPSTTWRTSSARSPRRHCRRHRGVHDEVGVRGFHRVLVRLSHAARDFAASRSREKEAISPLRLASSPAFQEYLRAEALRPRVDAVHRARQPDDERPFCGVVDGHGVLPNPPRPDRQSRVGDVGTELPGRGRPKLARRLRRLRCVFDAPRGRLRARPLRRYLLHAVPRTPPDTRTSRRRSPTRWRRRSSRSTPGRRLGELLTWVNAYHLADRGVPPRDGRQPNDPRLPRDPRKPRVDERESLDRHPAPHVHTPLRAAVGRGRARRR